MTLPPSARWLDPSIPQRAQSCDVRPAFIFEQKPFDALVLVTEVPLVHVAVLEDDAALEIVLAHRVLKFPDRIRRHGKFLPEAMPRETKRVFVAVNVMVKAVGILVEPHGELKRAPAFLL